MVFVKTSLEIRAGLDFLIRSGISVLRDGVQRFKSRPFDPNNPYPNYDEKNEYFNPANNICMSSIWRLGFYDLCERYYDAMLNAIREYERINSVNFNKGMAYANLGVAQVAQGKIDEGFANILKAHMEDEPYHKTDPAKSVFNLQLYAQFEDQIIDYIVSHARLFEKQESVSIDKTFVKGLLSSLDSDSRLLFVSVIVRIRQNLEVFKDKNNRFTRVRLFLYMQDLCLFVEDAMRKGLMKSGKMLKSLINEAFSSEPWKKSVLDRRWNLTRADNISDFEKNLQDISNESNLTARRFLFLGAVRNFSSHNLDVSKDYFFNNVAEILDNILGTVFYLRAKRII